jgi:hypothetical protein
MKTLDEAGGHELLNWMVAAGAAAPARAGVLADADLSAAEREAIVRWDPRRINALGGYLHLLMSIPGLEGH